MVLLFLLLLLLQFCTFACLRRRSLLAPLRIQALPQPSLLQQ
jgi:hypothetical protein